MLDRQIILRNLKQEQKELDVETVSFWLLEVMQHRTRYGRDVSAEQLKFQLKTSVWSAIEEAVDLVEHLYSEVTLDDCAKSSKK